MIYYVNVQLVSSTITERASTWDEAVAKADSWFRSRRACRVTIEREHQRTELTQREPLFVTAASRRVLSEGAR